MSKELKALRRSGVVEKCDAANGFLSRMFLIPKTNGKVRQIFDLRRLNFFLKPAKFRLINQNHIPNFLQENDYLGKLDISQAYFHIPIKKSHRRYLAFAYAGEIFQMTALPFGLSSAPLAFARVSKWLASYLRERGIRVLVYLDDFLFANQDPNLLEGQIKYVVNLLQSLGWCVNLQKSIETNRISRHYLEHRNKSKVVTTRKGSPTTDRSRSTLKNKALVLADRHSSDRKARLRVTRNPAWPIAYQTPSKGMSKAVTRSTEPKDCTNVAGTRRLFLVDERRRKLEQDFCARTNDFHKHRCLRRRLGSTAERFSSFRKVDRRSIEVAHKQKGALYHLHSTSGVSGYLERPVCYDTIRQPNSSILPAKSGRYTVGVAYGNDKEDTVICKSSRYNSPVILSSRTLQFSGRQPVEKQGSAGLAPEGGGHSQNIFEVGHPSDRSVCHESVKSSSSLCLIRSERPPGSLHQCIQPNLGLPLSMGISPSTAYTQNSSPPQQSVRDIPSSGPTLEISVLEKRPQTQSSRSTLPDIQSEQESSGPVNQPATTKSSGVVFRGLEDTGWGRLVTGLDPNDIELIQSAWRDSTWRTYAAAWKQWVSWCRQNGMTPCSPRPQDVATYLGYLSRVKKLAPATILVHKSVVVTLADPTHENRLASHPLVAAILKAINIQRCSATVSKSQIWNVNDLIQWLNTNVPDRNSIYQVSRHLAILLLLASGRRIHDLTLLSIDDRHCERSDSSITFWPRFGSKTDNSKFRQSGWQLSCSGDPSLSLVKWTNCLIDLSRQRRMARTDLHHLFITTHGVVKAASRATIAGWLKVPFSELGITSSPGSIRSAVASNNFQHYMPVDDILKRGNWRSSDNFFKHYCKPVSQPRYSKMNPLSDSFTAM
uniref:SFRICE_040034 n=1 Tax=Spodoptera frugiperda TaxID=7108 RepID=A0A2H1W8C5_SPOFR